MLFKASNRDRGFRVANVDERNYSEISIKFCPSIKPIVQGDCMAFIDKLKAVQVSYLHSI